MKSKNDIVYSINIEDIQTVAIQEIDRELNGDEIEKIKNLIDKKIVWYDAIAESINEMTSTN